MFSFLTDLEALFLGDAPRWYKRTVAFSLLLNIPLLMLTGPIVTGWVVLAEFILFLAMALYAYPLFPCGLLALEVVCLHMTTTEHIWKEITANVDVLLLVAFMVPAIYFMKPLLMWLFTRLFATVRSKTLLSLMFLLFGTVLSAWLDALTVMAVMIAVCISILDVMHGMPSDSATSKEETNAFMRGLLMHGAMGTMLGGVSTMVGEPQNLLIAHSAGWQFREFFVRMAHVSLPVFATGTAVCLALELFRVKAFGYGHRLPEEAQSYLAKQSSAMQVHDGKHRLILIVMGFSCVALVVALGMQLAAVGLVGLGLLIVVPSFTGQAREHALGESFKDVMPFAALLGVFFAIVAMIDSTGMFRGITNAVLKTTGQGQEFAFFTASGILSAVSDNVFVASIYINEAMAALHNGLIDKVQFDKLAIAINAGTNIFSIATPNGQAAFLFLLTSAVAKRTGLSYLKMLTMAVPYTLVLVSVAYLCMGLGR